MSSIHPSRKAIVSLAQIEKSLEVWLKPAFLAEGWDNVGLLIGSGKQSKNDKIINSALLCNDLKPEVLEEAKKKNANLIIAYHPLIFAPMKSIGFNSWKERLVAGLLAEDISVYCPHTTMDAIHGGINDALLQAFGDLRDNKCTPIHPHFKTGVSYSTSYTAELKKVSELYNLLLKDGSQSQQIFPSFQFSNNTSEATLTLSCDNEECLQNLINDKEILPDLYKYDFLPIESSETNMPGSGRKLILKKQMMLPDVIQALKTHLQLRDVKVATANDGPIRSIAVCVGSGGSLLKETNSDVVITGEMSHHEVLDFLHKNTSVILCGHCNSERHYLQKVREVLSVITDIPAIHISEADRSPLASF